MAIKPSALQELIEALRVLPGVGPRSAQRMAYHLLHHERLGAEKLAFALTQAITRLRHCQLCNTLSEEEICTTCIDPNRDQTSLCIVESPADQVMIEQTMAYKGLYFVLLGKLSPLDGIGPNEIHLNRLLQRISDAQPAIEEVILATNFTSEGDITAYSIGEMLKNYPIKISRLARGIPTGGELEYVDPATIARAVLDRKKL